MQEILNQLIDASFDRLVKDTQELVSINSVLDESTAGEGAPFGKGIRETLELILEKGKEMNMETKFFSVSVKEIEKEQWQEEVVEKTPKEEMYVEANF